MANGSGKQTEAPPPPGNSGNPSRRTNPRRKTKAEVDAEKEKERQEKLEAERVLWLELEAAKLRGPPASTRNDDVAATGPPPVNNGAASADAAKPPRGGSSDQTVDQRTIDKMAAGPQPVVKPGTSDVKASEGNGAADGEHINGASGVEQTSGTDSGTRGRSRGRGRARGRGVPTGGGGAPTNGRVAAGTSRGTPALRGRSRGGARDVGGAAGHKTARPPTGASADMEGVDTSGVALDASGVALDTSGVALDTSGDALDAAGGIDAGVDIRPDNADVAAGADGGSGVEDNTDEGEDDNKQMLIDESSSDDSDEDSGGEEGAPRKTKRGPLPKAVADKFDPKAAEFFKFSQECAEEGGVSIRTLFKRAGFVVAETRKTSPWNLWQVKWWAQNHPDFEAAQEVEGIEARTAFAVRCRLEYLEEDEKHKKLGDTEQWHKSLEAWCKSLDTELAKDILEKGDGYKVLRRLASFLETFLHPYYVNYGISVFGLIISTRPGDTNAHGASCCFANNPYARALTVKNAVKWAALVGEQIVLQGEAALNGEARATLDFSPAAAAKLKLSKDQDHQRSTLRVGLYRLLCFANSHFAESKSRGTFSGYARKIYEGGCYIDGWPDSCRTPMEIKTHYNKDELWVLIDRVWPLLDHLVKGGEWPDEGLRCVKFTPEQLQKRYKMPSEFNALPFWTTDKGNVLLHVGDVRATIKAELKAEMKAEEDAEKAADKKRDVPDGGNGGETRPQKRTRFDDDALEVEDIDMVGVSDGDETDEETVSKPAPSKPALSKSAPSKPAPPKPKTAPSKSKTAPPKRAQSKPKTAPLKAAPSKSAPSKSAPSKPAPSRAAVVSKPAPAASESIQQPASPGEDGEEEELVDTVHHGLHHVDPKPVEPVQPAQPAGEIAAMPSFGEAMRPPPNDGPLTADARNQASFTNALNNSMAVTNMNLNGGPLGLNDMDIDFDSLSSGWQYDDMGVNDFNMFDNQPLEMPMLGMSSGLGQQSFNMAPVHMNTSMLLPQAFSTDAMRSAGGAATGPSSSGITQAAVSAEASSLEPTMDDLPSDPDTLKRMYLEMRARAGAPGRTGS
ncbi:hypothetical protein AURDEDRAFT_172376 [Auricularia subglabra TFB-10046 SS5]|nr:hypothetical protein AURDEDRAFT_172376 [Auricularia subglabra TFB-10046 SS5]